MKHLYPPPPRFLIFIFILFLCFLNTAIKADPTHTYEAMFTLINYGSSWNVTIKFEAVSIRWDENFNFTTGYVTGSETASSTTNKLTAGFDFIADPIAGEHPIVAYGKYKISAWEGGQQTAYFYMDWRTTDSEYTSVDVYFKYDVANNRFRNNANTQTIDGTTQTLWNLRSDIDHITTGFETYTPINLSSTTYNGMPKIIWERQSSQDYVTGFDVYRSLINQNIGYEKIGTSTTTSYVDYDLSAGSGYTAYYKIKAVNGTFYSNFSNYLSVSYSGLRKSGDYSDNENSIPYENKLHQNYPNPFNPTTTINYTLQKDGYVTLKVFNLVGEEVIELVNAYKTAGEYNINFTAENLPSGIYLYKLFTNNYTETKKFVLAK